MRLRILNKEPVVYIRVEGQLPRWMHRGPSQGRLRRQLWKVEEGTVQVPMKLGKVWDACLSREVEGWYRRDVANGSELHTGGERWVLGELPAELSEQAYNPYMSRCGRGSRGGW